MAITVSKKPPVVALCDNVMLFEFTTDFAAGTEDYRLLVQPWYTDGGLVTGTDRLFPVLPGSVQADFSEYLRRDLQGLKPFVFPEQGNVPWNARTGLIKEYKIRTQEIYTNESGDEVILTDFPLENRFVCRGKIPRWIKQKFYAQYASFYAWVMAVNPFMTFSPVWRKTLPTQIQKLYFLVNWLPQAGDKLKLRIAVTFTDGTGDVFLTTQESAVINQWDVIEFSASMEVLALDNWAAANYPGKVVDIYTVTVMSGEDAKSETKTFEVDRSAHQGEHQFLFANSLPGYDTIVAYGSSELYSTFEYDVVDQQRSGITNNAEQVLAFMKSDDSVICRTGYIDEGTAEWMAEFFESKEIYEVESWGLVPVILLNAKILRKKDGEGLYVVEFEYRKLVTHKVELG